jgi:hypothetical protein
MTLTFSRIESTLGKRRAASVLAAIFASAIAAAATAGPAAPGAAANDAPAGKAPGAMPTVGVYTGRYANGVPVYRLPPVTVVGSRRAELAKTAREQQRSRVRYGRADDGAQRTN